MHKDTKLSSIRLIGDVGSTKADWALINERGVEIKRFSTIGLNALLAKPEDIANFISNVDKELPKEGGELIIDYYGAGCATPEICERIESEIAINTGVKDVNVNSDLLGAARSLLCDNRGIACILGTGSNSCLYDGKEIASNTPSLGFILGDEGSGAALGKRFISDILKGVLPIQIKAEFLKEFNLTFGEILNRVYRCEAPNRFLASLVPFIKRNIEQPGIRELCIKEFESFLQRNLSRYEGAYALPVSFTGSIAYHFADLLREAAANCGFKIGTITSHPLDGLIKFHTKHLANE